MLGTKRLLELSKGNIAYALKEGALKKDGFAQDPLTKKWGRLKSDGDLVDTPVQKKAKADFLAAVRNGLSDIATRVPVDVDATLNELGITEENGFSTSDRREANPQSTSKINHAPMLKS